MGSCFFHMQVQVAGGDDELTYQRIHRNLADAIIGTQSLSCFAINLAYANPAIASEALLSTGQRRGIHK